MGIVSFNRVKIYFICGVLQVLDKVWNISNIYKDHVLVQADLISLLESLGVRIAAIRELLLVDDFEFKFKILDLVVLLLNIVSSISKVIKVDACFGVFSWLSALPSNYVLMNRVLDAVHLIGIVETFNLLLRSDNFTITPWSHRLLDILFKFWREYARKVLKFLFRLIWKVVLHIERKVVRVIGVVMITGAWALFDFKVKFSQHFVLAADKVFDDINCWKSTIWVFLEM